MSQQVAEDLTSQILTCRISPGTALSGNELCSFFEISYQPVRKALPGLSISGLVQVMSQRGSAVSLISVDEVRRA